jgi:hypothetical protein
MMKRIYAMETIDAGDRVVVAGDYAEFEQAEAERLIANGAAADPDSMIVSAQSVSIDADFAARIDAFESKVADSAAALASAHAEIDRLTVALAEKKAK